MDAAIEAQLCEERTNTSNEKQSFVKGWSNLHILQCGNREQPPPWRLFTQLARVAEPRGPECSGPPLFGSMAAVAMPPGLLSGESCTPACQSGTTCSDMSKRSARLPSGGSHGHASTRHCALPVPAGCLWHPLSPELASTWRWLAVRCSQAGTRGLCPQQTCICQSILFRCNLQRLYGLWIMVVQF